MIAQPASGRSCTHVHRHRLNRSRSHQILRRKESRASSIPANATARPARRSQPSSSSKSLLSSTILTAKSDRRGDLLQSVNAALKTGGCWRSQSTRYPSENRERYCCCCTRVRGYRHRGLARSIATPLFTTDDWQSLATLRLSSSFPALTSSIHCTSR